MKRCVSPAVKWVSEKRHIKRMVRKPKPVTVRRSTKR